MIEWPVQHLVDRYSFSLEVMIGNISPINKTKNQIVSYATYAIDISLLAQY
jgi:hypothetical protein